MTARNAQTILLAVAMAAASLPGADGAAEEAAGRLPPIAGTVIQYQDWMMRLDRDAWRKEFEAMRQAEIGLVVIQWLEWEGVRFMPEEPETIDPTAIILELADSLGMRVFVGLATDDRWHERIDVPGYLDRAAAMNMRLADRAWARYGRHASFAGWYLPQELRYRPYRESHTALLREFFRRQSDHCHALSPDRSVCISPAPAPEADVASFRRVYAEMLTGSGVDIVMLQDGVGALRLENRIASAVIPYFAAMADVCASAGIRFWSIIEIHQRRSLGGRIEPAPLPRIRHQLEAESPYVSSFVMFDFFHYMSPHRGEAQRRLFEAYLAERRGGLNGE